MTTNTLSITTSPREAKSKKMEGFIPAVYYGAHAKSTPIFINAIDFQKVWKSAGESSSVVLKTEHGNENVMIQDVQFDPVKSFPRHVDFYVVEKGQKVHVKTPIIFIGDAPAVKAGGVLAKVMHELSLEGWHKTIDLNLNSLMLSNQAAIKQFLKQGSGGTILNMSSVLGYSPSREYFSTHAYAAAKSAILGFSKSIASYYATNNIRVDVIAPALVETPMAKRAAEDQTILSFIKTKQPLDGGRIGHPSDLDGLAVYFMSDLSRFTTGQVIAVDGGWSVSEGQL